ncbi:hypothetical protein MP228_007452 [Amoeboaphelidium protococcarum]|nr:hypothetical protein MP228_007452 [Amoeboaphelidium protococcarum]
MQGGGRGIRVSGWVKAKRKSKNVTFLHVACGNLTSPVQCVLVHSQVAVPHDLSVGNAVTLHGDVVESQGGGQSHELIVKSISLDCQSSMTDYPLQNVAKKQHSLNYLRQYPHLRSRTSTFGCVNSIRNALLMSMHRFLQENQFLHVHTPVLTLNDCEAGAEAFQIDSKDFFGTQQQQDAASEVVEVKPYLTTSHQLHLEQLVSEQNPAVYTIAPCFRADLGSAHSRRHLSEFYMCEVEVAYPHALYETEQDANGLMSSEQQVSSGLKNMALLSEQLIKCSISAVLDSQQQQLKSLQTALKQIESTDKRIVQQLEEISSTDWPSLDYGDAFQMINSHKSESGRWEDGLSHQDEQLLLELMQQQHGHAVPVVVKNYPQSSKPFYMRENDGINDTSNGAGNTVACFDILMPNVGELVGGSVREERSSELEKKIRQMSKDGSIPEALNTYLESKRYGAPRTAGFGVGFDRLVMLCTGMDSIKDVIPFGRWRRHISA